MIVDNIEFFPLERFPGYSISKCGKIFSDKSNKILKLLKYKYRSEKIYLGFVPYINGKAYSIRLHRLLAEMFIEKPDNQDETQVVDHKDNNSLNNDLNNLQQVPKRVNSVKDANNTTGYSNISYTQQNTFRVRIKYNGKEISKSFSTLNEALEQRTILFESLGLPLVFRDKNKII